MRKTSEPTLTWNAMAGCAAGVSQTLITCPMELVKTRAQLSSASLLHCFRNIIKREGGVRALYRGLWATIARDAPAFTTYFYSYELLVKLTNRSSTSCPSTLSLLFAGGTAGALSWLVVYPVDVIKSRIQANVRFNSMSECVRLSYSEEGMSVFMRGVGPTLVRAFPTNAVTFAVVTWTLKAYENWDSEARHNHQNVIE